MVIHRDVARRAGADPGRPAVFLDTGPLTFGELADRAADRAVRLDPEQPLMTSDDPVDALVDLLAADSVRATAILAGPALPPAERERLTRFAASAPRGSLIHLGRDPNEGGPIVRTTTSWTWSYPAFSVYIGVEPTEVVPVPSLTEFPYETLHALTMGASVRFAASPEGYRRVGSLRARGDARYLFTPALAVLAMGSAANGGLRPFPGVDLVVRKGRLHARTPYAAATAAKDADGFADTGIDGATISAAGALTVPAAGS